MDGSKAEKIYGLFVFIILAVFMCSIGVYYFQHHNASNIESLTNVDEASSTAIVEINWQELYPFREPEEPKAVVEEEVSYNYPNMLRTYLAIWNALVEKVDTYTSEMFVGRIQMIMAAHSIKKICNWPYMASDMGRLIEMENGYLTYPNELIPEEDINEIADSIEDFERFLASEDIPFLFINAGSKVNPRDRQISLEYRQYEYTNENGDNLIEALNKRKIEYIDFREEMLNAKLDWYEAYYKADHHWKNTTQLWATGILADKLNSDYGFAFDLDYFDINNYSITTYQNILFGGQGRIAVDLSYREDYDLILPQFETNFTYCVPTKGEPVTGEYDTTLIDLERLERIKEYSGKDFLLQQDAYHIAEIHNEANNVIFNNLVCNNNDKKLLILQDSFAWYLTSYLAMDIKEIDIIHPLEFDGSIQAYVEKTKPDMVLLLYCERNIQPIDWSTHKSPFDLR